jgi:hypothetical protein
MIERNYIIPKILFIGKANTKIARDFEPLFGEPRFARRAAKSMGGAERRPRKSRKNS